MSVIVLFHVPADEFPLGELLEVKEGVRVRLESMVPTGDSFLPYFWVGNDDADAVYAAVRESPLAQEVQRVDETESETLFRVTWSRDIDGLLKSISDSEAVMLESEGQGDHWSFRLRFPQRSQLSAFYQDCTDKGIPLDLREVYDALTVSDRELPLTERQREALLAALDEGYYRVPREVTLQELAAELGISDTALSQRLRRGLTALLTSTLAREKAN